MGNNIILVGFMGTGKSAIGRRLSMIIHKPFYDADTELEKLVNQPLKDFYKKHGKIRFQSEERLMVKRLLQKENCIIVVPGTLVINRQWLSEMKTSGIIICFTARPEVIAERVLRKNNRPFLRKEFIWEDIESLSKERAAIVEQADLLVDTSDSKQEEILEQIINFL